MDNYFLDRKELVVNTRVNTTDNQIKPMSWLMAYALASKDLLVHLNCVLNGRKQINIEYQPQEDELVRNPINPNSYGWKPF